MFHNHCCLEVQFDVESHATQGRHHEVVDSLVVVAGGGDGLGVERRLAVYHPEVVADCGYGEGAFIPEQFARNGVAYGEFL